MQLHRNFTIAATLNAKANQDPVQKILLDKLKEYNKLGDVPMTPEVQRQFNDETARLKRLYGADKEDLSKFPTFNFDKQ